MAARPPARHLVLGLALLLAGCTASASPPAPSSDAVGQLASSAPSTVVITEAPATPAVSAAPDPTPEPTVEPTPDPTPDPTPKATPERTPKPAMTSGRTGRIVVDGEDLAIKLPKGWMTLALSEADVQAVVDALPDGTIPDGIKDQLPALMAAGLKMWAFDTRKADLGDNVNVVGQPVSLPYAFLKPAAQAAIAQYPNVTHATYRDTTVDGEPALRVGYTMTLDVGTGPIKESGTQLYIPRAGRLLVITITTRAGHSADDVRKIVSGIELLD